MLTLETTQPTYNLKARIAGAVAATCAVGVVAAVAMSNTSATVKRTGLFNIPEDIKGHFTGGQVNNGWTATGKFHKFETESGDWQIDSKLTMSGSGYQNPVTYTLKNNVLTREETSPVSEHTNGERLELTCGDREDVPGYGKWADLLDNARAVSHSDLSEQGQAQYDSMCPEGSDAVVVKFEGDTWTVCGDSTAQTRAMYAFNDLFYFQAVSRPTMVVDIEQPAGYEKLNCTEMDISLDREEYSKAYLDMMRRDDDTTEDDERELYEGVTFGSGNEGGGRRNGDGPDCLFFHGVGGKGDFTALRPYHANNYWGKDMDTGVARDCGAYKVMDTDTFKRGYDTASLLTDTCNAISAYQSKSASTVIFTHSMGGLYTRKAFATEGCGWKGKYYQSQPPMDGSNAASVPQKACAGIASIVLLFAAATFWAPWIWVQWVAGALMTGFAAIHSGGVLGGLTNTLKPYCNHALSPVGGKGYRSIKQGLPWFAANPYNAGNGRYARADGRLCGYQPQGYKNGGVTWRGLVFIQNTANLQRRRVTKSWDVNWYGYHYVQRTYVHTYNTWGTKSVAWNDGMVPVDSCEGQNGVGKASITYMNVNHSDGTGREGTSTYYMRNVFKWYTDRQI